MSWCRAGADGVRLTVLVAPNGKRNEVLGVNGDALKIRLRAQPVEGRANEALIVYLAELLGMPRGALAIKHGLTARRKIIDLRSGSPEEVERILLTAAAG